MARIGSAKGGTGDQGAGRSPAPAAGGAGGRRGAGPQNRRARPPTPQAPQRPTKQGTVTKAVQVGRASRFLNEVATELRKVSWPTRPQLFQSTAVVLVFVAIITAYLAGLDAIFSRLVDAIF